MVVRTVILLLLTAAVSLARTVCPCPLSDQPTTTESIPAAHKCCGDTTEPKETTPPCPKHGGKDSTCCLNTLLAPADKALDAPPAPLLTPFTLPLSFDPQSVRTPVDGPESTVLIAPSPPLRCSLHGVFLH